MYTFGIKPMQEEMWNVVSLMLFQSVLTPNQKQWLQGALRRQRSLFQKEKLTVHMKR